MLISFGGLVKNLEKIQGGIQATRRSNIITFVKLVQFYSGVCNSYLTGKVKKFNQETNLCDIIQFCQLSHLFLQQTVHRINTSTSDKLAAWNVLKPLDPKKWGNICVRKVTHSRVSRSSHNIRLVSFRNT